MLEKFQNIVYDCNYTAVIPAGGFVQMPIVEQPIAVAQIPTSIEEAAGVANEHSQPKLSRMDRLLDGLGLLPPKKGKQEKQDNPIKKSDSLSSES